MPGQRYRGEAAGGKLRRGPFIPVVPTCAMAVCVP